MVTATIKAKKSPVIKAKSPAVSRLSQATATELLSGISTLCNKAFNHGRAEGTSNSPGYHEKLFLEQKERVTQYINSMVKAKKI